MEINLCNTQRAPSLCLGTNPCSFSHATSQRMQTFVSNRHCYGLNAGFGTQTVLTSLWIWLCVASQKWRTFRKNAPSFFKTKDSALKMEVTYYFEMPIKLGQTERRHIPKAQTRYWFNLRTDCSKTSALFVSLRTSAESCPTSFRCLRISSWPISNYPDRNI
jgi:hypothetical protein